MMHICAANPPKLWACRCDSNQLPTSFPSSQLNCSSGLRQTKPEKRKVELSSIRPDKPDRWLKFPESKSLTPFHLLGLYPIAEIVWEYYFSTCPQLGICRVVWTVEVTERLANYSSQSLELFRPWTRLWLDV